MVTKAAELVYEMPEVWRKGNIIYTRVPGPHGEVIRAYPMDVAIKAHAAFGLHITGFFEEQDAPSPIL